MKSFKNGNIIFGSAQNLSSYSHAVMIYDKALTQYKNELIKKTKLKKENVTLVPLKATEESKSLKQAQKIFELLAKSNVDKKSVIIGLGGGVIGDIAGFIASTYLRGLSYVAIPTTILSQVDSSIGGKNGVNLSAGKNLIGTITQPTMVIINHNYIKTLPERELISGLGEILKYSLLTPKIKFPVFKEVSQTRFLKTIKALTPLCVEYKMSLVQKDEFDVKGIRQRLNLGHTFGHALESLTEYKRYKHGEAVIWGIKFACIVSYTKGLLSFSDFRTVMNLANKLPVPALPKNLSALKCYKLALKDKKSENLNVRMVLLKAPGRTLTNQSVSQAEFMEAVKLIKDFS